MTTMLIAFNGTRENGNFMGDQLCALKAAYLFVESEPSVDKVILSASPNNEMLFVWQKFIDKYNVQVIYDDWNPGDWSSRWAAWDKWRSERVIEGLKFDHYRELYLRIHGGQRQSILCGYERGLGRRNIYSYWYCGQEHSPEELPTSVDWFDDSLCYHPKHTPIRDVYIAPHCKTQGNYTFTFDLWSDVVHRLIDAGVSVTIGYDGYFCPDLNGHPLVKRHWGNHEEWFQVVCNHKIVACGNTGTGWVSAACGVPLLTMEPPNSQMPDHRYRQCGLKNIVEVIEIPDADYVAKRLIEFVQQRVVMTTGCYDILHAGHVRHLEKARALGSKLIVALNSDSSVKSLKGPERPINTQEQRKTVLEALRCVDEVKIFDGPDALALLQEVRPDILACGFGYTEGTIVGRDLVKSWGGKVVVTSQDDATNEPSTTKIIHKQKQKLTIRTGDVIELCRVAQGYSVNPFDKLKLLAEEFLSVVDLEGDVADLGTYRGGSALVLRRLAPTKDLHLFDTWEGNPYNDDLCHHKEGEWKADLEGCKSVIGVNLETCYHPGIFPQEDWGEPLDDKRFCFVYVDMDTYKSTKDAIEFFWPKLVAGGKMVIDDYGWEPCAGVKKAVDEMFPTEECERYSYMEGIPIKRIIQSQYTCVLEKK